MARGRLFGQGVQARHASAGGEAKGAAAVPTLNVHRKTTPRLNRQTLRELFRLADAFAIMLCVSLAFQVQSPVNILAAAVGELGPFFAAGVIMSWLVAASGVYCWVDRPGRSRVRCFCHVGAVAGLGAGLGWLVAFFIGAGHVAPHLGQGLSVAVAAILILHVTYRVIHAQMLAAGALTDRIVVIGVTDTAARLIGRTIINADATVVGVFHDRDSIDMKSLSGAPILGDILDLLTWPDLSQVDRIVVCLDPLERTRLAAVLARIIVLPHPIALAMETPRFGDAVPKVGLISGVPMALISGEPHGDRHRILKRGLDLLLGTAALGLSAPLLGLIAVAVRLESPGPVIIRQDRYGQNNAVFRAWKFRTLEHLPQKPAFTAVGKLLHRTGLDELPQLINVLLGEMSIVGPRPDAVGMKVDGFDPFTRLSDYAYRHRVKPGLTGLAQVNGARGTMMDLEALEDRLAFDLAYVRTQTLWLDLWILARTLPALFGERRTIR